jgi:ABC-type multidrug transport system ATPase subunit
MSCIEIHNLCKSFDTVRAVFNISLNIDENTLYGFIGPDGAGKTTIFRILATLLIPDKGEVFVKGYNVVNDFKIIRRFVGYMAGRFSLYPDLTVEENIKFYATIFGTSIKKNYQLIKTVYSHIEPFKNRLAGKLSGGMKQKLALCCALIHNPQILILDEPTTGVDAVSRREFWELLKELKDKGMTILVSTAYMDEASLCDHVALMQRGTVMMNDKPENIISAYNRKLFALRSSDIHRIINDIRTFEETQSAYLFGQFVHLTLKDQFYNQCDKIITKLEKMGHENITLYPIKPEIEDCFIAAVENQGIDN